MQTTNQLQSLEKELEEKKLVWQREAQQLQNLLEEEQLYSEHLEKENDKLSSTLLSYRTTFEQQSSLFKSTI